VTDDPTIPVVRVDFQNSDALGRVRLNTAGAHADIVEHGIGLELGQRLRLVDGELSADGDVVWSDEEQLWVATVDWDEVVPRRSGNI
jgi:hypothetical protein